MSSLLALMDENGIQICQDAYVVENPTQEVKVIRCYLFYVCVAAASDDETKAKIAQEIFRQKSTGCDMNGGQIVEITDESELYSTAPIYQISFDFAQEIPLQIEVLIARPQVFPSDWINQIKTAIYNEFKQLTFMYSVYII